MIVMDIIENLNIIGDLVEDVRGSYALGGEHLSYKEALRTVELAVEMEKMKAMNAKKRTLKPLSR